MAVSSGNSFLLASISAVLIFSGMQMYKPWIVSSPLHLLFGGYLANVFFFLLLTATGNIEAYMFGKSYQVKLFPEVLLCLLVSTFSAMSINRICASTGTILSIISIYYMNKHAQKVHGVPAAATAVTFKKKK